MMIRERRVAAARPVTDPAPPPVTDCAAAPDPARLRGWVERLAVPRHISANPRGNRRVRDELVTALERCGLAVQLQGMYDNVVALPRVAAAIPVILVAAHYDSVPHCPGADDNASALAAMLECARVLSHAAPALPVGFVAFNAEEDGLLGSRDFVDALPALGRSIAGVHVLEMVGYRGDAAQALPLPWVPARLRVPDYLGLLAKNRSNPAIDRALASPAAPGVRVVGVKTWGPVHRLLPDLTRSDHFPFWLAGLPAVLWTDTGNFRNPHYHQPTDTPDTLDYGFLHDVTALLCAVITEAGSKARSHALVACTRVR